MFYKRKGLLISRRKIKKNIEIDSISELYAAAGYRDFIRARIEDHKTVRGYQRRLAEAAGCRPSYLSQVLNSHVQLTPDQAAGLAEFWRFSEEDTEFFLALVGCERSSAPALRRHLERRLALLRQKHSRLSNRIKAQAADVTLEHARYYGNWWLPALHVLVGIPTLRTAQLLSARLRLPEVLVQQGLDHLVRIGLIKRGPSGYEPSEKSLHLPDDSPFLATFHGNWRQQAILRAQERGPDEVHYTGHYALGAAEVSEIRELIVGVITRSRELAVAAPEETTAVCMLCDFFPL